MIRQLAVTALFFIGLVATFSEISFAGPIIGTGLNAPTNTINFSEVPLVNDTSLSNQFSAFGISSLTGFFYDTNFVNVAGPDGVKPDIKNFLGNDSSAFASEVSIRFTGPVTDFVTSWQSIPAFYGMTSYLNNVQVEVFTVNNVPGINGAVAQQYGLHADNSSFNFDEIRITAPGGLILDNFQFNLVSAVPEPSSWAMMCIAGIAAATYRRRKSGLRKLDVQ